MAGAYLDKDNPPDGKVAWYPSFEGEKPPAGQEPSKVESQADDTPPIGATATDTMVFPESNPRTTISSKGEITAEINE